MLYIVFKKNNAIDSITWRVDSDVKAFHAKLDDVTDDTFSNVELVQADGHELSYIRRFFTNIPDVSNKSVVSWFGDHARFIAANLKS